MDFGALTDHEAMCNRAGLNGYVSGVLLLGVMGAEFSALFDLPLVGGGGEVTEPARSSPLRPPAHRHRHRFDLGRNGGNLADMLGGRIAAGIGGVKAIDIR